MSVNDPNLFVGIYEPFNIPIFYAAGEAMSEMMLVKMHTDGKLMKAVANDEPFGFVTQDVTSTGISDQSAINGLISRVAKIGDKVGVYMNGGILKTDRYYEVSSIVAGTLLYSHSSGGYICDASGTNRIPVGIADGVPVSGVLRFKCLI